jgi:hypothetical protein
MRIQVKTIYPINGGRVVINRHFSGNEPIETRIASLLKKRESNVQLPPEETEVTQERLNEDARCGDECGGLYKSTIWLQKRRQ